MVFYKSVQEKKLGAGVGVEEGGESAVGQNCRGKKVKKNSTNFQKKKKKSAYRLLT